MSVNADKLSENISHSLTNGLAQKQIDRESVFQFVDCRTETINHRRLHRIANNSSRMQQLRAFQKIANSNQEVAQVIQFQPMGNTNSIQRKLTLQKKENNKGIIQLKGWKKRLDEVLTTLLSRSLVENKDAQKYLSLLADKGQEVSESISLKGMKKKPLTKSDRDIVRANSFMEIIEKDKKDKEDKAGDEKKKAEDEAIEAIEAIKGRLEKATKINFEEGNFLVHCTSAKDWISKDSIGAINTNGYSFFSFHEVGFNLHTGHSTAAVILYQVIKKIEAFNVGDYSEILFGTKKKKVFI